MKTENGEQESGLERRVEALRAELRTRDMDGLAHNTGAAYENGRFRLNVWNMPVILATEDFIAIEEQSNNASDVLTQAMLAYYFHTSDGSPVSGEWMAFRELPDGQFYASAFQGYTGNKLAALFGDDVESFSKAARKLQGRALPFGDAAFQFRGLPRVPVAVVCWLGDEDFPSSYRLLFDSSIDHQLPTDACAILGSMLTSKLAKAMVQEANS